MQDLVIQPQQGKKGRSFSATCVAVIKANLVFPESSGTIIRPVWAMFANTEPELRPFMTNLKLGRKAEPPNHRKGDQDRFEFLRSVGYHMTWQRETEGALATIYHPELFRLDPGMVDPDQIQFVMTVPKYWADQQTVDVKPAVSHVLDMGYPLAEASLAALLPTAYLFAAYLDRRTRCPLIADGRFYLQLLCAALDHKLASFPGTDLKYQRHYDEWGFVSRFGFNAAGLEDVGILHALCFAASHTAFEEFLAEQVARYFDQVDGFVSVASLVDLSYFLETGT